MTSFILSLFLLLSPVVKESSIFELEEIVYPHEIVIPKKWEEKDLFIHIKIYYIYTDVNIIVLPQNGKRVSISKVESPKGKIYFYLKRKIKVEDINGHVSAGRFGNIETVLYANYTIYLHEIPISLSEDIELREALRKKELSKILVWLDEVNIRWEIEKGKVMTYLHKEKGDGKIKINKTIEIKVKYEK